MMTPQDFVTVFELALESENYQKPYPKVTVKDVRKGSSRYRTHSCTLPRWVLKQCDDYAISYAVHEAAHFVAQRQCPFAESHGPLFKMIEKKMLAKWDLVPVYSKAYLRELKNAAGQSLWNDTAIGKTGGKRKKRRPGFISDKLLRRL